MISNRIMMWIIAGLSVALTLSLARSHSLSLERDVERGAKTILASNLVISNASLDECLSGMSDIVADGAARDDRLAQAARLQMERAQQLKDEAAAIMRQTPSGECRTSDAIMRSKNL